MLLAFKGNKKLIKRANFHVAQRDHGIHDVRNYYINNKTKIIFHPNNHNLVHLPHFNLIVNSTKSQQANKFIIQVSNFSSISLAH